jgi:hypothetical protein
MRAPIPIRDQPGRRRLAVTGARKPAADDAASRRLPAFPPGEVLAVVRTTDAVASKPRPQCAVGEDIVANQRRRVVAGGADEPGVDAQRPQVVGLADVVDGSEQRALAGAEGRAVRCGGQRTGNEKHA